MNIAYYYFHIDPDKMRFKNCLVFVIIIPMYKILCAIHEINPPRDRSVSEYNIILRKDTPEFYVNFLSPTLLYNV